MVISGNASPQALRQFVDTALEKALDEAERVNLVAHKQLVSDLFSGDGAAFDEHLDAARKKVVDRVGSCWRLSSFMWLGQNLCAGTLWDAGFSLFVLFGLALLQTLAAERGMAPLPRCTRARTDDRLFASKSLCAAFALHLEMLVFACTFICGALAFALARACSLMTPSLGAVVLDCFVCLCGILWGSRTLSEEAFNLQFRIVQASLRRSADQTNAGATETAGPSAASHIQ